MSNWVLNIVGGVEQEVEDIVAEVVKASTVAGHSIRSVRLTTDEGEKILHIGDMVGAAVDAVVPAAAPDVKTAEADLSTAVGDAEKVSEVLNPQETVQTPPPEVANGVPVVDVPPPASAPAAIDPESLAAARALVAEADAANPPQAV